MATTQTLPRTSTLAREAFAIGWASATAARPVLLTERARRACAATELVAEASPEPVAATPTLQLGRLEGTWAVVYDRRHELLAKRIDQAKVVWTNEPPDLAELVRLARRDMGLGEASPQVSPAITSAAAEAALSRPRSTHDLVLILGEGLAEADAEGTVGALALAATEAGNIGFDFDLAFQDAVDALNSLSGDIWTELAGNYVQQALAGTVNDLGRTLGSLMRDQASYADMLTAVTSLFDNANAIAYSVDLAMSTSLTQGALNLYASEGVAEVNFVTAGDERVDEICEAAGVGSPYDLALPFPQPPLHGFCRCCVQANDALPDTAFARYVTDNLDEN